MKVLVVLAVVAVSAHAVLDDEMRQKIKEHVYNLGAECNKEIKASEDDVAKLKNKELPQTHEGKCLLFCLHKGLKLQDEAGKLTKDEAITYMDPIRKADEEIFKKVKTALEQCMVEVTVDSDPCVTAYNLMECGNKKRDEHGLAGLLIQ